LQVKKTPFYLEFSISGPEMYIPGLGMAVSGLGMAVSRPETEKSLKGKYSFHLKASQ